MFMPILVSHLTTEEAVEKICESGSLFSGSCIADVAKHEWMRRLLFLPKTFTERGTFCFLEEELPKWKRDKEVWDYVTKSWVKYHGDSEEKKKSPKTLVKLSFEVNSDDQVSVFDEEFLFVSARKFWKASFLGKLCLIPDVRKSYCEFVSSRVNIEDYQGNYALPSVFIKKPIPIERIYCESFRVENS